jgi:tRNA (guanine37-N1)-methyltransferase
MRVTVLTLFPEMFPGPLGLALSGKALAAGLWQLETLNLRDFGMGVHKAVDDTPYGGGAGMVLRADVLDAALTHVLGPQKSFLATAQRVPVFYLSPRGERFNQGQAKRLTDLGHLVLLCGRYEGVDQRVLDAWQISELSLGDFILSGGEMAALAMLDACVRLVPGVMSAPESADEESFSQGLLEYPHYTRPAVWQGREVPSVLVSGHHRQIKLWRQAQSEAITQARRPDLWAQYKKE